MPEVLFLPSQPARCMRGRRLAKTWTRAKRPSSRISERTSDSRNASRTSNITRGTSSSARVLGLNRCSVQPPLGNLILKSVLGHGPPRRHIDLMAGVPQIAADLLQRSSRLPCSLRAVCEVEDADVRASLHFAAFPHSPGTPVTYER
jgi:hypothetical protein